MGDCADVKACAKPLSPLNEMLVSEVHAAGAITVIGEPRPSQGTAVGAGAPGGSCCLPHLLSFPEKRAARCQSCLFSPPLSYKSR